MGIPDPRVSDGEYLARITIVITGLPQFFAVMHTQFLYQISPKLPGVWFFQSRPQLGGVTMYCWPMT
jgi:hypothetical protein